MERWLCARRTVRGDAAAMKARLMSDTPALLQVATGSKVTPPEGDGSFRIILSSEHDRVHKVVAAQVGEARQEAAWSRIPLSWKADPLAGLFATFEGDIEIEDLDHDMISIAVVGRYRPPAGMLGGLADRLLLSELAEITAERIVRGLVGALSGDIEVVHGEEPGHMTVGDLMTTEAIVLDEAMSLRSAASLMLIAGISGAPVVDDHGRLVGILSESDLLDKVAPPRTGLSRSVEMSWRRHGATTVGEACTRPAITTDVQTAIRDAAALMASKHIGRLVVMQGAVVAGIVTRTDVIKALVREDEAIEAAVEVVLESRGLRHVTVDVDSGEVTLGGTVDLRSDHARLPAEITELEGVINVRTEDFSWIEDDVVVPPPMWI